MAGFLASLIMIPPGLHAPVLRRPIGAGAGAGAGSAPAPGSVF